MVELGATDDPRALVPGIPESVEDDIATLRKQASTAEAVGQDLTRVDVGSWNGQASQAFQDAFANEPPKWLRTCDLMESSAKALDAYVETLRWAQSQAAEAIRLWEEGEQATLQARARYDAAVAETQASAGDGHMVIPPFDDPGDVLRQQARELLDRARTQLREAGNTAAEQVAGPGKQGDGHGLLAEVATFLIGAGNLTMSGKADFNGPNAGAEATAPSWSDLTLGSFKAHANLFDATAQGKMSYGGIDLSGKAAASLGAQATAAAGITGNGLESKAAASAGLRASASGKATYGVVDVGAKAYGFVGGEAGAHLNAGQQGVDVGVDAFVGAKAGASGSVDVAGIGVGATAEAWAGFGAEATFQAEMQNGEFTLGGKVGAAVFVGGSVSFELTIDPAEVADTVSAAAGAVGGEAVIDTVGNAANEAWDTMTGLM